MVNSKFLDMFGIRSEDVVGVIVCGSREMRAKRQVVEGVISQIKLFNAGSGCGL